MKWHELIFSEHSVQRRLRHLFFWVTWWWFFFSTTYWLRSPHNRSGLWESSAFQFSLADLQISMWMLIIHIITCYFVIWVLLPRYLLKGKYFMFVFALLAVALLIGQFSHFIYQRVFPQGERTFISLSTTPNNTWWASISAGPLSALKITAIAVTIKLLKRWWIKEKENQQLERERINAELQLLKAQIHPGFLFNTLNNIYVYALAGSPKASEMLLRLADLLSYMLYECDRELVPLDKEIEMMRHYMLLEKVRMNDGLEMEVQIKGDPKEKLIAPFLLLPFIENSFKHCRGVPEKSWLNLEIRVEGNNLVMKLINGIPLEMTTQAGAYENGLVNVQKRLNLLYPETHELKMNVEKEMFIVSLRIGLVTEQENLIHIEEEYLVPVESI